MTSEAPNRIKSGVSSWRLSIFTADSAKSGVSSWRLSDLRDVIHDARDSFFNSPQTSGPMMDRVKFLLLSLVPFMYAARSIGYSWALSHGSAARFSPLGPLVVSQLALAVFVSLALRIRHGMKETRMLCSRRYGYLFVTGTLAGASFCLQNLALTRIAPTLLTVLMSTQALPASIFQIWILRLFPSKTQWASLVAGLLLATQHVLSGQNELGAIDIIGILCGLGAATCLALAGLAFQCFVGQFTQNVEDKAAEVKRLIIANELWKFPVSLAIMLMSDYDNIANFGFFYGWDWPVVFGALLPAVVMTAYRLFAISSCGALATSVASSAEVAIVFLAEFFVLGRDDVVQDDGVAVETLGLGALLLTLLMFNLSQLELQQVRLRTLWGASLELDKIDAITKRITVKAHKHAANEEDLLPKKTSQSLVRFGTRRITI